MNDYALVHQMDYLDVNEPLQSAHRWTVEKRNTESE